MNREIKFRAWNKELPQMVSDLSLHGLEFYGDSLNDALRQTTVMQFTGLKDRKGIEIYEGDILSGHEDGIGKVVWSEDSYVYEFLDGNIIPLAEATTWFGNIVEVIGNIYKNPEVLEKE